MYIMNSFGELSIVAIILIIFFIIILGLLVIQYCWNNTVSILTNTVKITMWQSLLLLVLFRILFNNGMSQIKTIQYL